MDQLQNDEERDKAEKIANQQADIGNISKQDLLVMRAEQDDRSFMKKATGSYILGGYLKKDADGGQYNRGNNHSAYSARTGGGLGMQRFRRQDGQRGRARSHFFGRGGG